MLSGDSTIHIAVAECTSVKEEIIEDNMDTEDPLSVQGRSQIKVFYSHQTENILRFC